MNAMPLTRHLLELRQRLLRSVVVIVLVFIPLFMFAGEIYTSLAQPLMQALPEGGSMIATDVTGPFLVPFKFFCCTSVGVSCRRGSIVAKKNLRDRYLFPVCCCSISAHSLPGSW